MNFKLLLVLFVTCYVAWAQEEASSSSPAPLPEQPVEPVEAEVSSTAQPQPVPQVSSSATSSAPAQEPSPTVPPAVPSSAAQNPSSPPPAVPPPEEEQGAQSSAQNEVSNVPPAGIVTDPPPTTEAPPTTSRPTTTPTTTRPTTTPAPKPVTPPAFPKNTGSWSIKEVEKSGPCLIFNAAMQIHVKGNSSQNISAFVENVPNTLEHVVLNGTCGPDEQKLSISWYSERNLTALEVFHNKLTLRFTKQVDSKYALNEVSYHYNIKDQIPQNTSVGGPFFLTSLDHSYRCHSEQRVETEASPLFLLTDELQFEAFRDDNVNSTLFAAADECKADHRTSTAVVVGIGFGIGLLIVVCIALGVYLFKRFRNREGYQPLDSQN